MAAILALDLALLGLLLTARVGRAGSGDAGGVWLAASLGTGMATLCAPWFAAQPASIAVDLAFVLCNSAGFLLGPCLIEHARAMRARQSAAQVSHARCGPDGCDQERSPYQRRKERRKERLARLAVATPFALALIVYGMAGLLAIGPRELELWIAIPKSVLLVVSAAIALTTLARCAPLEAGLLRRHPELCCLAVVLGLGLATLPAALVGGELLALEMHEVAVLPALGACLWLLAWLRLRGPRPDVGLPRSEDAHGLPDPPRGQAQSQSDRDVLAAVYAAFAASLEIDQGWRDDGFGLDDAARHLGIGRHLLSAGINQHVVGGFVAAVKRCRLAAFRAALATAPENESVLAIGLRCGFGSKASLQRLVKRDSGLSPGALRSALRAQGRDASGMPTGACVRDRSTPD